MTNLATRPTDALNAPALGGGQPAPIANWWEAAPLAQDVPQDTAQAVSGGNWWESAPLASKADLAPAAQAGPAPLVDKSQPIGQRLKQSLGRNPIQHVAVMAEGLGFDEAAQKLDALGRGGKQGVSLAFEDELAGLGAAMVPGGEDYTEAVNRVRSGNKASRAAHPKTFVAGEIGGGLATGGAGGGRVVTAQGLRATTVAGAKTGTIAGGAYGAGSAEGNALERADDAAKGAGLGALGGAILTPLVKGMGSSLQSLATGKGQTLTKPDALILKEVMRANDVDRPAALQLIQDTDLADPRLAFQKLGLEDMARGVESAGDSRVKNIFAEAVKQQQAGQQARISEGVKRIIGADDFTSLSNDAAQKLKTEGAELYNQVLGNPIRETAKMQELAKRPAMKVALRKAREIQANKGANAPTGELGFYQTAKEALDDLITSRYKSGKHKLADSMRQTQRELLAELDAQSPGYAKARSTWAGVKANQAALEYGRNALRLRPEDIARDIEGFSKSERQHLLAGVLQGVDDRLKRSATSHDATKRFQAEGMRDAFRVILPQRQADAVIDMLERESAMTASGRAVRSSFGSQTAPRQESAARIRDVATSAPRKALGRTADIIATPIESPKSYIKRLGALARRKTDPAIIEALAVRLAGTPDEVNAAYAALSPEAQAKTVKLFNGISGGVPFISGQQAATP